MAALRTVLAVVVGMACAEGVRGLSRSAFRSPLATTHRTARAGSAAVMKAEKLDTEGFKEAAQGDVPIVVDVYAQWCGPCQLMAPFLDEVADMYSGKVRVVKVDADEEEELAAYLRVQGLPTLLFIRDRQVVGRIEGAMMKDEISAWIEHHFFGAPVPASG